MQAPVPIAVEVRWWKRIRESVEEVDGEGRFVRSYRFGVQFVSPSDEARILLRQYVQQLTQAGAV